MEFCPLPEDICSFRSLPIQRSCALHALLHARQEGQLLLWSMVFAPHGDADRVIAEAWAACTDPLVLLYAGTIAGALLQWQIARAWVLSVRGVDISEVLPPREETPGWWLLTHFGCYPRDCTDDEVQRGLQAIRAAVPPPSFAPFVRTA